MGTQDANVLAVLSTPDAIEQELKSLELEINTLQNALMGVVLKKATLELALYVVKVRMLTKAITISPSNGEDASRGG